jgi:hypothetical protein
MSKELILHPKAKYALNAALAAIIIMLAVLIIPVRWIGVAGITISFLLSIFSIVTGLISMKLINKQEDIYRGNNMAWISFILGVLIFLSTIPFVIQFLGTIKM